MNDKFNREINYARISVTDRCNLRCRYCMPECGVKKIPHADILTLEEILRVARIFARLGIKKIRLTGGEPLLRRNLSLLIREMKNISGIEQIFLTTNGVLLKNLAPELILAGLDGVNLSLDTLNDKTFSDLTRRKLFNQVMDGFNYLIDKNLSLKINCVPLRGVNESELINIAALAENYPIKIRFIELMPIGCAFESGLRGIPTAEIFSALESNFGELLPVNEENSLKGPAKYFKPRNFIGQIGFIDALEHKFCSNCNRIRLTAEGFLKTCLSFNSGLDVKNLLRLGENDDKILEKVRETIFLKPKEHLFKSGIRNEKLGMYRIGG